MRFHRYLIAVLISVLTSAAMAKVEPYPLEYWALRDTMRSVEVSPDGKYLAFLHIRSREGNPILEVHKTADLLAGKDTDPYRVAADPMEFQGLGWVDDGAMIISLRQQVRDRIDGFNEGVYKNKLAMLDVEKQQMMDFEDETLSFVHPLPDERSKVLVSTNESKGGSRLDPQYRPRSYYVLDLKRGTTKLLIRSKISLGAIQFDQDGDPWLAQGFDQGDGERIWYYRPKGSNDWVEIYRLNENSFETFQVEGFDHNARHILFVTANNGHDKVGLWEFDTKKKDFKELIYRRPDVDVRGVVYHSNSWAHRDEVVGVSYLKDEVHIEYFSGAEEALRKTLEQALGDPFGLQITSRSKDGNTMTIRTYGPRDPGTFYLLAEGKLVKLGSSQPLLEQEKLADVKYIEYPARDGRKIPAYLTVPQGEGPFPLVVMPHGGPFVSEFVAFDEWGQMLANNGYMVLQPQYRGSRGHGLDHYTSAFMDGGQGGYKMQDDKDDGVKYLIKEGMVDPNRVAMFGWSYGGYAALVAASREDQLYQCVIAGAAVSDTVHQVNFYRNRMRGASEIEQVNMWTDSISPVDETDKVNVPVLLIHGSVDQRVPPVHVERYISGLEKAGKPYKYVELEGADHFSNTLFYHHQIKLYENMIGYLKNDCGPEGI